MLSVTSSGTGSGSANFTAETPLHPDAANFLTQAFGQGWPDTLKIHHPSRQAALLLETAKTSFASHLGVHPEEIHFLGEPALGFQLGISGLDSPSSRISRLICSGVDRSEVFSVAREFEIRGRETVILGVDSLGNREPFTGTSEDLLTFQLANGETGSIPDLSDASAHPGPLFVDATASGARLKVPQSWSTALWDSRAWAGPAGLGILAIKRTARWQNPLPSPDLPNSFSVPLALCSAIALESWLRDEKAAEARLRSLRTRIINFIANEIGDCDIADSPRQMNHIVSASFLYIDSERLLHALNRQGIAVDSGSACSSEYLEPSHVLIAMGLLSQGNIRVYLHHSTTNEEVDRLLNALKTTVDTIRSE